ncbi:STAS domain-containing protein [Sphingomonas sp.]|jgi:anti-anti-sigma regulatory factor|uniref:STAS domain-containing protein n=1 Tax=Sphingomonas sp. TaxID=28214 RepID=UPI002ED982C8
MTLTLSPSDPAPDATAAEDRALQLPANCTTVKAEDFRVRLVLAADFQDATEIDASEVESIGQATLQLLVAAKIEAEANHQRFAIVNPSPAFVARVEGCRLAEAIGLELPKGATL